MLRALYNLWASLNFAGKFYVAVDQSAKNYKTFTPQAICNIQYFSLDIFMKTLQKTIVITTIIHSSQVL